MASVVHSRTQQGRCAFARPSRGGTNAVGSLPRISKISELTIDRLFDAPALAGPRDCLIPKQLAQLYHLHRILRLNTKISFDIMISIRHLEDFIRWHSLSFVTSKTR
jgi:hypothetical protein